MKTGYIPAALAVLSIVGLVWFFIACGNDTTTGPDPVTPDVVVSLDPTPTANGEKPRHCKLIHIIQRRIQGSTLVVEFEIAKNYHPDYMRVKVLVNVGGLEQFVLIEKGLFPGKVYRFDLDINKLRDAKCGVKYDVKIWVEGVKGDLVDQCDGGAKVEWSCKEDKECKDIPPKPPGDCVLLPYPTCDWQCSEPKCPVPNPPKPADDCTWTDYPDCKWECGEKCTPPAEPPCKKYCTYDEETCTWDCTYPNCGEYYSFNFDTCTCEGLPLCHVSNKGQDGNWNLQESQKKFTPGHELHLDPNLFCPPDYLGTCDGRYLTNPHPCMLEN